MKRFFAGLIVWAFRKLNQPDYKAKAEAYKQAFNDLAAAQARDDGQALYMERAAELAEARQMTGAGPWTISPATLRSTDMILQNAADRFSSGNLSLQESDVTAVGSMGEIDLMLSTLGWRREVSLSWLEFSRWGIQQIILISRLYYLKNPLIARGVNVVAYYVFGRGVELSSTDDQANEVLRQFQDDNKAVMGQSALSELQKRLYYDGQVFFVFFSDKVNTGTVKVRTIDATEIQEIVTDPDDTDTPRFYKRMWAAGVFNEKTGTTSNVEQIAWYPELDYNPAVKAPFIGDAPVMWDSPVIHMKGGAGIAKWHFDVPKVFAALDWAREVKRFLEACATVKQALKSVAITMTQRGGQNAIGGTKDALSTTMGPNAALWDINPQAGSGSTFVSGPGTKIEAFNTRGQGGDPDEVRQFKLMVAMVFDIPESFFADMNTSNLATAMALDRPTELAFLDKQERWREVLIRIGKYVLTVNAGAPSGRLREAGIKVIIREAKRVMKDGRMVYEAGKPASGTVEIKCTFPSIREGDTAVQIAAIADAMTLGNKGGQIVGIDEKEGVRQMYAVLGVENAEEILGKQYPAKYDPDRTKEPLPAPIGKALPAPGGQPQLPGGKQVDPTVKEAADNSGGGLSLLTALLPSGSLPTAPSGPG